MPLLVIATAAMVSGCKPIKKSEPQPVSVSSGAAVPNTPAEESQDRPTEPLVAEPDAAELQASIAAAAAQNQYAFLIFHSGADATGSAMRREVEAIVNSKLSARARCISIDAANQANAVLLAKYGVSTAHLPLTIVLAPNGAITGGYPKQLPEEEKATSFAGALTSPRMADVLLAIQQGKLAAICVQGAKTKHNSASLKAARSLAANPQFAASTIEIIKVDPSDTAEAKVMQICRIDPSTTDAQLVIIAPPGRVVGKFPGTASAKEVASTVIQALSGSGGG